MHPMLFMQETEKMKRQARGCFILLLSDDEEDVPGKSDFQGGPHRLEFILGIRNKAGAQI